MSLDTPAGATVKPLTVIELLTKPRSYWDDNSELPQLLRESNWKYKRSSLTVVHDPRGYCIDLKRITSSAQLLDWIYHVNEKSWATPTDVGELVRLLGHIFAEHPAPGGRNVELDVERAIEGRPLFERDY